MITDPRVDFSPCGRRVRYLTPARVWAVADLFKPASPRLGGITVSFEWPVRWGQETHAEFMRRVDGAILWANSRYTVQWGREAHARQIVFIGEPPPALAGLVELVDSAAITGDLGRFNDVSIGPNFHRVNDGPIYVDNPAGGFKRYEPGDFEGRSTINCGRFSDVGFMVTSLLDDAGPTRPVWGAASPAIEPLPVPPCVDEYRRHIDECVLTIFRMF